MKTSTPILPGALLAALLSGCAGYNHTLFMTKSNVGLDFDSKPPTLEINVSRKEAVIAPSFEGGKTPPVMASFKPSAGTGGSFGSFFMGVDQTFAGGDAAMAMSRLYNQPTATDITKFDSSLELSEKPAYKSAFRKIPGAGATRPLIFGTDTSLGLKAAWSGAGGQIPDTVKLGFNRKEFAWAPLTATPKPRSATDTNQDGTKVNVKMPAFLATVESKQSLDTDGTTVGALQYFATGDAATYLAMQKDVRAAMHARLDPNSQAFKGRFGKSAQPILRHMLSAVYNTLSGLQNDPIAVEHVRRLDHLDDLDIPDSYRDAQISKYAFIEPADNNSAVLEADDQFNRPLGKTAAKVTAFLATLEENVRDIRRALAHIEANAPLKIKKNNSAPADLSDDDKKELAKQLARQDKRLSDLKEALSSDRTVIAAFGYLETLITPK